MLGVPPPGRVAGLPDCCPRGGQAQKLGPGCCRIRCGCHRARPADHTGDCIMTVHAAEIGVWTEAGPGSRWSNEGMQRLLGFLIEGSAKAQLPVLWRIVVPPWLAAEATADLRSLKAMEDVH